MTSPETDTIRKRQFIDDEIHGAPSDELAIVDYVVLDPAGDASAKHQNEPVVFLEQVVPCNFQVFCEIIREIGKP